uniref:Uncharacterized protein n=2 Tax=Picea TaxID=3328 RepID=A0A101M223_PICGL|nr:hypothetical protein ABT39_MTgene4034 [Picea glauca]QHR89732.1 hypothetical protein Q903MT_gene3754 [Picea sitchensis]
MALKHEGLSGYFLSTDATGYGQWTRLYALRRCWLVNNFVRNRANHLWFSWLIIP